MLFFRGITVHINISISLPSRPPPPPSLITHFRVLLKYNRKFHNFHSFIIFIVQCFVSHALPPPPTLRTAAALPVTVGGKIIIFYFLKSNLFNTSILLHLPPLRFHCVGINMQHVPILFYFITALNLRDCLTRWIWLLMTCLVSFRPK
jgi:hypothetical protein